MSSALPTDPALRQALSASDWRAAADRLAALGVANPHTRALAAWLQRSLGADAAADAAATAALAQDGPSSPSAEFLRESLVAAAQWPAFDRLFPDHPPGSDVASRLVAAVHAIRRDALPQAVQLCQSVLAQQPDHSAAHAHLGRALHNLGRPADALKHFRRAVELDPLNAEGHYYLAFALRAGGDLRAATAAFEQAQRLRPGFVRGATQLAKTWLALDDATRARAALQPMADAGATDADLCATLGAALRLDGALDDAERTLAACAARHPQHAETWLQLGTVRNQRMDTAGARTALERAAALAPNDPEPWAALTVLHECTNDLDAMTQTLKRGVALHPGHPGLRIEAARLERRRGRPEAALQQLARGAAPESLPPAQRQAYWFESGRNLDRLGRSAEAWAAFTRGNALAAEALARMPSSGLELHALLVRLVVRLRKLPERTGALPQDDGPVFLLGFPRSGITLINLMLAGHPAIATLEEQPTIEQAAAHLATRPGGYPDALDTLDAATLDSLRTEYRAAIRARTPAGRTVVDMFPIRTLHLELIARLFPGARVLFVEREPADVVLSNWFQDYAPNPALAAFCDLGETAAVHAASMELFHFARTRLPLRIATLRYESLVAAPEPTLRAALDAIALPWHPAVLDGHAARARQVRVSTSSYHQVAEPLYDDAVGRWQRYASQLQSVQPTLARARQLLGYT